MSIVLELPSDLQIVEQTVAFLVECCQRNDFAESRLSLNFRVGVTEALANAILYGNNRDPSKRVRISMECTDTHVAVEVADEGDGFDPDAVPDPTLPENLERSGGRGVFLIRHLMDHVDFGECGNSVRLVLHRSAPSERSATGRTRY